MIRCEALEPFYYNGKTYQKGEQFDSIKDEDIPTLKACHKAVKILTVEIQKPPVLETVSVEAEQNAEEETEETNARRRNRQYKRRDMRPEE